MINPAAYTKFDSCKNASEFIVKHPDVYNVIRMMREMGCGVDMGSAYIYATDSKSFSEDFYRACRALNHNQRFMRRPMVQRMIHEITEYHVFNFQKAN